MGVIDSIVENVGLRNAVIFIDDTSGRERDRQIDPATGAKPRGAGGIGGLGGGVGSLVDQVQGSMDQVQNVAQSAGNQAAQAAVRSALGANGDNDTVNYMTDLMANQRPSNPNLNSADGVKKRMFEVQFNPSTISLSGFGGGKANQMNFSSGDNPSKSVSYDEVKPRVEFSTQLVFDDSKDYYFTLFGKTSIGEAGHSLIEKGVGAASTAIGSKLMGKKYYTVQQRVEALLAALRSPDTRFVTFAWGAMAYFGTLNGVSARYTLFDIYGTPVRAQVEFRMVCNDSEIAPDNMGFWQRQYERL